VRNGCHLRGERHSAQMGRSLSGACDLCLTPSERHA
jgi:hypothetical protein